MLHLLLFQATQRHINKAAGTYSIAYSYLYEFNGTIQANGAIDSLALVASNTSLAQAPSIASTQFALVTHARLADV